MTVYLLNFGHTVKDGNFMASFADTNCTGKTANAAADDEDTDFVVERGLLYVAHFCPESAFF